MNISHPLDFSHKRRARTDYAIRAVKVTEAQYQDAVRIEINNLYTAFVDVLAARQTLRLRAGQRRRRRACYCRRPRCSTRRTSASRADVSEIRSQLQIARVGLLDAEENLRKAPSGRWG